VYTGLPGYSVQDLTHSPKYPGHPDATGSLESFQAPPNFADEYGQRIEGLIVPSETGDYVFEIAADDSGELYLSPDEDPAHARKIAYLERWTPEVTQRPAPEQRSAPVRLEAGKRYYLAALMKEQGGGDALSVKWTLPSGGKEDPIPEARFTGGNR
jgi:hypothetical protein